MSYTDSHSFTFPGPIELKFERNGIPIELIVSRDETIKCSSSCPKCRGTTPGCKISPLEKMRLEIVRFIERKNRTVSRFFKRNMMVLFFFWRVGHNHFRFYESKVCMMNPTQHALIDFKSKHTNMLTLSREICEVDSELSILVSKLFPNLKLSLQQWRILCEWMEDEFPVAPMCIRKKMLMTSIALGFLVKRLVGPLKDLRLSMFHAIFKQTLLRKRNSPNLRYFPHYEDDLLNLVFLKIPGFDAILRK